MHKIVQRNRLVQKIRDQNDLLLSLQEQLDTYMFRSFPSLGWITLCSDLFHHLVESHSRTQSSQNTKQKKFTCLDHSMTCYFLFKNSWTLTCSDLFHHYVQPKQKSKNLSVRSHINLLTQITITMVGWYSLHNCWVHNY